MGSPTHTIKGEIQGWLTMFRVSNAPTIISNILVGIALGNKVVQSSGETYSYFPMTYVLQQLVFLATVVLLVYFGGMVLNDAIDAKRDQTLCPHRPIPLGIISVRDAWLVGFILLTIPLFLAEVNHRGHFIFIAALDIAVLAYTFLHRWMIPSVVFMALCRSLVYVVALGAFVHVTKMSWHIFPFMLAIGTYTALLTYIGRTERTEGSRQSWVLLLLLPAFVPFIMFGIAYPLAWIAFLIFATWIWHTRQEFSPKKNNKVAGMHTLLAGFCLLDCVFIASLGGVVLVFVSAVCFILTLALQREIQGT